jgi:very-short-patch-repair endonuclease
MILPRQKFWLKLKGKQMYGYDFHRKTDWQLYFRLFLLRIDAWIEVDGYSHEFFSSMKGWVKENRMNELGLLFEI